MRAVNNTLREIILRERPLTVTNNDSLVLSPPLPSPPPLFASLSIHPFAPPPPTCFSTLFLFTPRDLLVPIYTIRTRADSTSRDSAKLSTSFATVVVVASSRREVLHSNPIVHVYVNTNAVFFASSFDEAPSPSTNFFPIDPRLENVFFLSPSPLARPSSLDRPVA